MLVGGLKTTMSLGTALNSYSIGVNTGYSCCLKGTATPLLSIHPIMCDTCTQWWEGATRWSPESDADEDRVQKNPICVFVVTAEKRRWGGYGGSFVVWSRSKELRNWGAGSKVIRPGLLKSGCTSPRCEAWRLTRWKAGSSPARAPDRCHTTMRRWLITRFSHTHTLCCNPNQSASLSGEADFIDEF